MISQYKRDHTQAEQGTGIMNHPYIGKERRSQERRVNASERRELVRYEINKSPRRSGKDRRKVNGWAEHSEYQLM